MSKQQRSGKISPEDAYPGALLTTRQKKEDPRLRDTVNQDYIAPKLPVTKHKPIDRQELKELRNPYGATASSAPSSSEEVIIRRRLRLCSRIWHAAVPSPCQHGTPKGPLNSEGQRSSWELFPGPLFVWST